MALTVTRLRELVSYNAETGDFTYNMARSPIRVGDIANSRDKDGYIVIMIDGRRYKAHRLVWLYEYGRWPPDQLDHINGITSDNRLINLREASHLENMRNRGKPRTNTSGLKGACFHKNRNYWIAQIKNNGKNIHLGCFDSAEEAHAAYRNAAQKIFGEFART